MRPSRARRCKEGGGEEGGGEGGGGVLTLTRRSREGGGGEDGAEAITSGSMCMKSWIGPRVVESIRGRGNLASRGLIRSRLEPRWWPDQPARGLIRPWAGLIRSRLGPVVAG